MDSDSCTRRSIDATNPLIVPGVSGNKAFAALEFQAVRVREKKGTFIPAIHHNDILTSAVDHHYRNMSHLSASSIPKARSEARSEVRVMSAPKHEEVEEFVSDSEEDDEEDDGGVHVAGSFVRGVGIADGSQLSPRQARTPVLKKAVSSSVLDTSEGIRAASRLGGGVGGSSRKGIPAAAVMQEMDPVAMLKRMRSEQSSRSIHMLAQERHPCMNVLKGPGHQVTVEDVTDDDAGLAAPRSMLQSLRAKSFLARPNVGCGAADDLLAQIRGSGWQSASLPTASAIRPDGTNGGSTNGGASGSRQLVAGSSKSFSAAGRKGTALPGVSVDSTPRLGSGEGARSADPNSSSSGAQAPGPHSGGLFNKLKSMIKRG
ncbi:hypothetical protein CHLRE_12g528614v5 [Chlamydomonas reinhardtii]|uniref:Uncharacterized protein n=1 Tax=Chlamydomonas reinhardtii TaxID=3055 RepID=A0A2K3D4M4_CHLRE|nr:uncharacterized protein CHLRE_12g528614v5 [Chlamydomonas reinhardtii]PNW75486.1 hypothetical protein CHLRE_12g528614v5 [Chlamydomonas reinhardtii]